MLRWLTLLAAALLPAFVWVGEAAGDWATAQSPRGVVQEPNDFWYWHRISGTNTIWDFDPVADISYDENHTYFWYMGPNYLNMPRAWGIIRHADPDPVVFATTDTEFLISHWDLEGNVIGDGLRYSDASFDRLDATSRATVSPTVSSEIHGTTMSSIACAVTDNDSWWVGREATEYLPELASRNAGVPGICWNVAKLLPCPPAGESDKFIDRLIDQDASMKVAVMNCSWAGHSSNWADRLYGADIVLVAGSGNDNWEVNSGAANRPCLVAGAVEKSFRRARFNSSVEDGCSYRNPTADRTIDVMGYAAFGGGIFSYNEDPELWAYRVMSIASSQVQSLGLGWFVSDGTENLHVIGSYAKAVTAHFPGVGAGSIAGSTASPVISPALSQTDMQTSGTTVQASAIVSLVRSLYPWITSGDAVGMVRRGCVSVDSENIDTCCDDPSKENCFTWVDGSNGYPLDGVMQDGGSSGPGEITGRIEGDDCSGLLGAGRLDAYRSMTLWGLVDRDTTLSGDVYVSGDVVLQGATMTIAPGTRFWIAPDDITYLDPWEPEPRYDMSASTSDGIGYFDTGHSTPYGQIEIVIFDDTAQIIFLSDATNPAIFDSFVSDAQTSDDWIGINDRPTTRISTPNGAGSYQVLHATQGVF